MLTMDQSRLQRIRRSPRLPAIAVGIAGLLLAAGLAAGWSSQASSASRELEATQGRLEDANSLLERYRDNERASIDEQNAAAAEQKKAQDKQDELQEKIDAVDEQQKTLDARQQKVEASEMVDGVHLVGTDTAPGIYSLTDSSDCYYVWKTGTGSDADIVDNNIVSGPATVTLKAGEVFETNGCGAWTKVG